MAAARPARTSLDPALLSRARELLNRARVLAEASAAQLGQAGRRHPSSRPPAGVRQNTRVATMQTQRRSTLEELEHGFLAAVASGSDTTLQAAIEWAEKELRLVTHGPDRSAETPEQLRHRIVTEHEGRHYADVAEQEHLHKTYIWKIRIAAGKDGVWGREKAAE